jgi:hypothetical protein
VLAATQTPTDKEWFQGTADAVRQYAWLFEDIKNRVVEDIIILSGDHLCARTCSCCQDTPHKFLSPGHSHKSPQLVWVLSWQSYSPCSALAESLPAGRMCIVAAALCPGLGMHAAVDKHSSMTCRAAAALHCMAGVSLSLTVNSPGHWSRALGKLVQTGKGLRVLGVA